MEPQEARTPTPASEWKKQTFGTQLELPSGNVALVRRIADFGTMIRTGKVPNLLMPMVQKALAVGRQPTEEDLTKEMEAHPEFLGDMLQFVDSIVLDAVEMPKVWPVPDTGQDRDPDVLYIDEVDLQDKMTVFVFATSGVRDLSSFREQSSNDVGDVPASEDVAQSSVGASDD